MEFFTVGQVVRTIGLKGEVKVYPSTHFRDTRFKKGCHVFLLNDNGEIERKLTIKLHRTNGDCDNLIFEEITSIEEAEKINKKYLFVEKNTEILGKNEYFFSDLVGMKVDFDNGKEIGAVKAVEEFTSYQTLRVKTNGKDVLIPFVKAFIKSVSLEDKKIIINYIDGLL
ncbi:MAG: 16S rRNA processing protein RimM [Bacilli bacterium]|nr:16S rRNA processing protein RimM [Bacilli bacterium]